MTSKILVVGSIDGQLQKAFQKISKLHQKTGFSFAIIVGDVFGEALDTEVESLLNGSITVPLRTYFTVGIKSLPKAVQAKLDSDDTGEVCSNLFYQGRRATLKTAEGIKIVFLGGRQVQSEQSLTQAIGKYDPLFLENEARSLQGAHDAHILVTTQWPLNIQQSSQVAIPDGIDLQDSTQAISNLCATLKPRYHFSSTPSAVWRREPFTWPTDYTSEDSAPRVTRFESLSNIDISNKEWLSAFTLDITKQPSTENAQRTAPFTFSTSVKRKPENSNESSTYNNYQDLDRPRGKSRNKRSKPSFNPDDCFMCIGRPQFDSNMLISIADESILTSGRGSLPLPETFPQLKSSGHILIIPMYHAFDEAAHGKRTISDLETELAEMTRYRHALHQMLAAKNAANPDLPLLGAVCWEVNRTGIRHFHWQYVACPSSLIDKDLVEGAFKIKAEQNQYDKFRRCDPSKLIDTQRSDFFRVWIWSPSLRSADTAKTAAAGSPTDEATAIANGETPPSLPPAGTTEISMFFPIAPTQRFNIQFGREVMAGLLKVEDRANWRDVPTKEGDEGRDAQAWKEDFQDFDFAMA